MKTPLVLPPVVSRCQSRRRACLLFATFLACRGLQGAPDASPTAVAGTTRQIIARESDLPRFRYPLTMPPSALVNADDATFNAFAAQVVADISRTTRDYEITDKATWRTLLEPLFCTSLLMGLDDAARHALPYLQANEEKEAVRLTAWRVHSAYLQAVQATGSKTGPEFTRAFEDADRALTDALPWDAVQDTLRRQYAMHQAAFIDGPNLVTGDVKEKLDPLYSRTGAVDLPGASLLILQRARAKVCLPLLGSDAPILRAYLEAHTTQPQPCTAER